MRTPEQKVQHAQRERRRYWASERAQRGRPCDLCGVVKAVGEFVRSTNDCLACRAVMKRCGGCSQVKALGAFSPNGRGSDGRWSSCRTCRAERARRPDVLSAARRRNKEQHRRDRRNARLRERRRLDPEYRARLLVIAARRHQVRRMGLTLAQLGERDGWRCWLCGQTVRLADAEGDHVVPISRGGSTDPSNVRLAHVSCNRRRGNREVVPPAMGVVVGASGYMLER